MGRERGREGGREGGRKRGRGTYLVPRPFVEHDDLLHRTIKGKEGVERVQRHGKQALGDAREQHVGRLGGAGAEVLGVLDVAH